MTVLEDLTRGDQADILISNLLDGNGNPATFGATDVLRWTAKADLGQPDAEAILAKTSVGGGITIAVGGATATVHILPADWTGVRLNVDQPYDWDLELLVAGVASTAVTIASGTGTVVADVTGNPTANVTATGGTTCTPWATSADAIAPCNDGVDTDELDLAMQIASDVLYEFTNRKYRGTCVDEIRPTARWRAYDQQGWWPMVGGARPWRWGYCSCNRSPDYGCARLPQITLPGYPVDAASIDVMVDGVAFTDFVLLDKRNLVRTDGDGWPCCQDLMLETTEEETWSIRYGYGNAPPTGGKRAAVLLGCELYKAWHKEAGECALPQRVTNISRQGVSMAVVDPLTLFSEARTGISYVDLWVAADTRGDRTSTKLIVPGRSRSAARTR